jgi:hypothetical protein
VSGHLPEGAPGARLCTDHVWLEWFDQNLQQSYWLNIRSSFIAADKSRQLNRSMTDCRCHRSLKTSKKAAVLLFGEYEADLDSRESEQQNSKY